MSTNFSSLVARIEKYNLDCDMDLLKKAYIISRNAHKGQHRVSGEP